jgi:hypothetical protein
MTKQTLIYALIGSVGLSSLLLERSISQKLKKRRAEKPDTSKMMYFDKKDAYRRQYRMEPPESY